ncbi:hypothetical protein CGZ98_06240 [Enemella evansiae]|uniref:hypothetical protein n=1 Tax=Enemella evansiae TaxID=2016499 RepID=UPI000B976FA7|nr:hypothetical protein [Enemella evansiae]OYO13141.1 hypothetical protein CGZ98_06240 [Enemella evansiae]
MGQWWLEFLKSPAIGGIAAVAAACIAWAIATKDREARERVAEDERNAKHSEWWWERAQWSMNLLKSRNEDDRVRGRSPSRA